LSAWQRRAEFTDLAPLILNPTEHLRLTQPNPTMSSLYVSQAVDWLLKGSPFILWMRNPSLSKGALQESFKPGQLAGRGESECKDGLKR
jgi:hypothetical protein